jgi:exopolyphosphatase/pppGpp-phosphohydrolase
MIKRIAPNPMQGRLIKPTYGIIDIGSNNCHLSIYGIGHDGLLHKLKSLGKTETCKLGEGIWNKSPVLKSKNLDCAVESMGAFRAILTDHSIPAQNTLVVMTEAIRTVQGTPLGDAAITRIIAGAEHLPTYILSGEEEANADGLAINLFCPQSLKLAGRRCASAFAAIGGGSIQFGIITPWGAITDAISLPYGIIRLMEESGGNIEKAILLFNNVLKEHCSKLQQDNLIVLGRQWRALGDVACQGRSRILKGNDIGQTLIHGASDEKKFHHINKRVRECQPYLPLSAAMLDCVIKRFETTQLEFVDTTIRDAFATTLHAINTGRVSTRPAGLERLFSHLTP